MDAEVDFLGGGGVDERAIAMGASEEAADFIERGDSGGEADALEGVGGDGEAGLGGECGEALEAEGEMDAAFAFGEGVDFIDDSPADGAQSGNHAGWLRRMQRLGVVRRMCGGRVFWRARAEAGEYRRCAWRHGMGRHRGHRRFRGAKGVLGDFSPDRKRGRGAGR